MREKHDLKSLHRNGLVCPPYTHKSTVNHSLYSRKQAERGQLLYRQTLKKVNEVQLVPERLRDWGIIARQS